MSNKITDSSDREELYKLYIDLQEKLNEIEYICRGKEGWEAAKAYWFGNLSSGINDETYIVGSNPTFKSFLQKHGIVDEDGEFVELEEDDEEEE